MNTEESDDMLEHMFDMKLDVPVLMKQLFPLLVLNHENKIVYANELFYDETQYTKSHEYNL